MLSWMPQNDILGHPKTKLFITHCGSNGQYEAVYHGVPMLGIPMFADQGWNCARAKNKGISLCLDLLTFTADDLYDAIRELVDNATYRSNIRRLSDIFRDEPMDAEKQPSGSIT
jgi:glucuronosyltransferase